MAKTIKKEKIYLRKLVEKIKDLPLMGLFTLTQKDLSEKLIDNFRLTPTYKDTIENKLNKLIKTTYDNITKDKSGISRQTEITKITNELKNTLKISCVIGSCEISLNLQDTDFNEIAKLIYNFAHYSLHKRSTSLNAGGLITYTIQHYYDRITFRYKDYKFEPNLDKKINDVLEYVSKLNNELSDGFEDLRAAIEHKNFVYLCVQNLYNCTINSTFHILINYVIMSGKIDLINNSIGSTDFTDVEELISMYLLTWYTYINDIVTNGYDETKYDNYMTTHNQQINDILDILVKNSKLQLQYIVYYYLLIHIWTYCQCICETLTIHRRIITTDNMTITHSYFDNDNDEDISKDDVDKKMELYNADYVYSAYTGKLRLLRVSNRIGNYILQEFWVRLGNSLDTTSIHNEIVNQHDVLFNDLNHTGISFIGYYHCHVGYKKQLIKYYSGFHADVMLYTEKEVGKQEWIRINDEFHYDDESDDNGLTLRDVVAGIYVAGRDNKSKKRIEYNGRKLIATELHYTPSAIFFKGGAIVSLLIVICIIAIVVCVVIYVHDHYWFKSSKMITDEQK